MNKLLKENKSLKKGGKTAKVAIIKSSNTHDIDNFKLVIEEAESEDIKELRPLLDEKTKNVNNSIFILLSSKNETLTILCSVCLLYTSPSPRDGLLSRMPSSA